MKSQGNKVYVGMSGGVDSSVSAALLKKAGFDVIGVFIKVWQPDWMECSWRDDRLDAMRVAADLDIPFKTLDLEKEYKKEVVDYMISEYKAGRTPNPDVMCNKSVKFGGFYDWAITQGANFVATGHYARSEKIDGKVGLFIGKDENKDQTYFLWTLSQEKLSRILFPVGGIEKSEVRKLAKKFGLPNADKKDSQGLCFIGKVDIQEFLSHYIDKKKGMVIDEKGRIIGEHDGAFFLTLGERHGFTITSKTPEDKPYYVVAKDIEKNTVTVSPKGHNGALSAEKMDFLICNTNWIRKVPIDGKKYKSRIRHLGDLFDCRIESSNSTTAKIVFDSPIVAAEGQSIVLYDGEECLGGGIIM